MVEIGLSLATKLDKINMKQIVGLYSVNIPIMSKGRITRKG